MDKLQWVCKICNKTDTVQTFKMVSCDSSTQQQLLTILSCEMGHNLRTTFVQPDSCNLSHKFYASDVTWSIQLVFYLVSLNLPLGMSLRAHLGSSQLVFYLNILMLANSSTYFGLYTPVTVSPFMFTSLRLTREDLMSIYIILKCGLCMTTVMCNTYIPFQFEIKTTASALTCL